MKWINKVVLVRRSPDMTEAAVAKSLGYHVEFSSTLLRDFSEHNAIYSDFNVVR
jgi:hypothetical protein